MVWKASMGEEWASIEKLSGLHSALSDPIGSGLGDCTASDTLETLCHIHGGLSVAVCWSARAQ